MQEKQYQEDKLYNKNSIWLGIWNIFRITYFLYMNKHNNTEGNNYHSI